MAAKSKPAFYVTTPIYYVNDVPHIGHAYTTIIADALARFQKLAGKDVFFLTGTDEHGQKIEKAAAERGLTPKALADSVVGRAQDLWRAVNISHDFFIRTTMDFHEKGVQKLFQMLVDKGDIYKGEYKGWYCVSDENFLPDDVPLEADGCKACPDCGKKAYGVSEETYFFRLSAYQELLLALYAEHPEFVRPQSRLNEVTSFVRGGLKDLSITRTTVKWGIPVPGDPKHTIYVWFDALHNYVTGIGYDWNPELFKKFWPADIHLVGKDILRFHAVYWPCFLMSADLPLPKKVFAHGWWTVEGQKMSKSLGNVVDPAQLVKEYGVDPIRYFLLREVPFGADGDFSRAAMVNRINSDLANDLGNLFSRALSMVVKYCDGLIPTPADLQAVDKGLQEVSAKVLPQLAKQMDDLAFNKALDSIWEIVNAGNKYIDETAPWSLAKTEKDQPRLDTVLYQALEALRICALLIAAFMPTTAERMWSQLGMEGNLWEQNIRESGKWGGLKPGGKVAKPAPLFPRIEDEP